MESGFPRTGHFWAFLNDHDDFHRYFNRCLLGLSLLGLGLLCRFSGIKTWSEIGWSNPSKNLPWLGKGLLLGLASLTAAAAMPLLSGAREMLPTPMLADWSRHLVNALSAGLLVAVIEETLFRGVLFGLLRRDLSWRWAALAGSLFFAAMHFLDQKPDIEPITWTSRLLSAAGDGSRFYKRPVLGSEILPTSRWRDLYSARFGSAQGISIAQSARTRAGFFALRPTGFSRNQPRTPRRRFGVADKSAMGGQPRPCWR